MLKSISSVPRCTVGVLPRSCVGDRGKDYRRVLRSKSSRFVVLDFCSRFDFVRRPTTTESKSDKYYSSSNHAIRYAKSPGSALEFIVLLHSKFVLDLLRRYRRLCVRVNVKIDFINSALWNITLSAVYSYNRSRMLTEKLILGRQSLEEVLHSH